MKEARVRSEPQSHVQEAGLVPGGNREPTWAQVGVTTLIEVQASHPGWGGRRREALAKGVGGSGVGGGGQCRHGQLREAQDQAGRLQERAWQARLSGREGGLLIVHEFVLLGLVEWTQDFKKMELCIFQTFWKKKKTKKTCSGIF